MYMYTCLHVHIHKSRNITVHIVVLYASENVRVDLVLVQSSLKRVRLLNFVMLLLVRAHKINSPRLGWIKTKNVVHEGGCS